jgi:hypothetical protein
MNTLPRILIAFLILVGLILSGLIAFVVTPAEKCPQYERQLEKTSEDDRLNLERAGFAMLHGRLETIPYVMISPKIIASCENRIIASKYFVNSIAGQSVFKLDSGEMTKARADIAFASFRALQARGVWRDGTEHEIYNVVSDQLLPDWLQWQRELIRKRGLYPKYFTGKSFETPDASLTTELDLILADEKSDLGELGVAYFLRRNLGLSVSVEEMESALKRRGQIQKVFTPDQVERGISFAIKLAGSKQRFTQRDAWDFITELSYQ